MYGEGVIGRVDSCHGSHGTGRGVGRPAVSFVWSTVRRLAVAPPNGPPCGFLPVVQREALSVAW